MGQLVRFDLGRIIKDYSIHHFFESGTFLGDSVAYSLGFHFKQIISVEIIQEIAMKAKQRFALNRNVRILATDSVTGLQQELPRLQENILFWLDAHFPGADAGIKSYNGTLNEELRLPLKKEIETICALRKGYDDVFILDDLRIYEDGMYQNGNVPCDALPVAARNIDFIYKCFSHSHLIFRSHLDEGYILLFPKKKYRRAHFNLRNLFSKKNMEEDHYLVGAVQSYAGTFAK